MSNPIDDFLELKKSAASRPMPGAHAQFANELTSQLTKRRVGDIMEGSGGFGRGFGQSFRGSAGGRNLASALLTVGAGVGMGVAIPAANKIIQAVTKRHDYRRMMDHNGDLGGYKQDNPKLFRQAYDSLRQANPSYGRDPLISGAHMRKMMDNPEVVGLTLAEAMKERQGGPSVTVSTPKDIVPSMSMQTPRGGK